jgi:hypothetical protein
MAADRPLANCPGAQCSCPAGAFMLDKKEGAARGWMKTVISAEVSDGGSVSARRARGPLEKLTSAQRRASNFNIKILYRYPVVTLLRDRRDRNIVRTDNVIA